MFFFVIVSHACTFWFIVLFGCCSGMIAIDKAGRIACGTSTNGLTYKIPGWVREGGSWYTCVGVVQVLLVIFCCVQIKPGLHWRSKCCKHCEHHGKNSSFHYSQILFPAVKFLVNLIGWRCSAGIEVESIPVSLWYSRHHAGASVIILWTSFNVLINLNFFQLHFINKSHVHEVIKLHVHVPATCTCCCYKGACLVVMLFV